MSSNSKNALHQKRKSISPPLLENGDYPTEKSVATSSEAVLAVGVDSFFTDLPPSSLVPFIRNRLWVQDPTIANAFPLSGATGGSQTTAFNLFDVPENQSLILTFVGQTWLQRDAVQVLDQPTTYTALPTTVGFNGAAPLQVTINQNPIADAAGLYNDANWTIPNTFPWYPPSNGVASSGFITQRTNVFNFGNGFKVFVIVPESQSVGALYTATYGKALQAAELPDAISIVAKGYLAPTKVIQKARKLYGI
mgnify:CR=1 FL=1